jgi:hypothetical protein
MTPATPPSGRAVAPRVRPVRPEQETNVMDIADTALDRPQEQWRFKEGDQVYSGDEKQLGKVIGLFPDSEQPTYLLVEKGFLFHHDYYVPVAAVTTYDGERLYVDATQEEARQRWEAPPEGTPAA